MVNAVWELSLVLAEVSSDTVLENLDPGRRVAVVLALVGLGLLGVLLVVVTILAGRWARQDRPQRGRRFGESTPQRNRPTPRIPKAATRRGETMVSDQGSEDTKA
jgi:hypothetical protein